MRDGRRQKKTARARVRRAISLLKKAHLLCRRHRIKAVTYVRVRSRFIRFGFAHLNLFEQAVSQHLYRFVNGLTARTRARRAVCAGRRGAGGHPGRGKG